MSGRPIKRTLRGGGQLLTEIASCAPRPRIFALAQALTNDYEQFEALVEGETPGAAGER